MFANQCGYALQGCAVILSQGSRTTMEDRTLTKPVCQFGTNDGVTLYVTGRFDYQLYESFRDSYQDLPKQPDQAITVDLSGTTYLDSTALGLLLLLREHIGDSHRRIVLKHPQPAVGHVLSTANFDKLFAIEPAAASVPQESGGRSDRHLAA